MESKEGPVELPLRKVMANRWKIVRKLGEGGCGAVYKVEDLQNPGTFAALKAESNFVQGGAVLKLETNVLRNVASKPHVARLLGSGKKPQFSYVVMTLHGESLNKLIKKIGGRCSVSTMTRVGVHCLAGLKYIHDIGFVHRDIKPANLAMGQPGTPEAKIAHVLDFGLARQYAIYNKETERYEIRRPRSRASFRGTTRYCSVNMHDRFELGRVDDLWCMIYMLVEFRCALPWTHIQDKREVGEVKRALTDEDLLAECPMELIAFTQHLRGLSYYSRPDYALIYDLFVDIMTSGGFRFNDPYEWENEVTFEDVRSLHEEDEIRLAGVDKAIENLSESLYTRQIFEEDALGV